MKISQNTSAKEIIKQSLSLETNAINILELQNLSFPIKARFKTWHIIQIQKLNSSSQ